MSQFMGHEDIEAIAFKLQKELSLEQCAAFNHVWLAYLHERQEGKRHRHILSNIDGMTVMKAKEMSGYGNQVVTNAS